jgi:hypothetical protein
MLHKTLLILTLLSVACTHAVADESGTLMLYPLKEPTEELDCNFQLKGTKDKKIKHFIQRGSCYTHDLKGNPISIEDCTAVSIIKINSNQLTLRNISYDKTLYKNDDYVVEVELTDLDRDEVTTWPFVTEAVLTVKKGSLQKTFNLHGWCDFPN